MTQTQMQIANNLTVQIMPVPKKYKLKINNHISNSTYTKKEALKMYNHLKIFAGTKIEILKF